MSYSKLNFIILFFIVNIFLIANNQHNGKQENIITKIGSYNNGPCYDLCIDNNIVYLTNGLNIDIINVEDPSNPVFLSRILNEYKIEDIKTLDTLLLVTLGTQGLNIYSVSDPRAPYYIKRFRPDLISTIMKIKDKNLFLASSWQGAYYPGIRVFNFENSIESEEIGFYQTVGIPVSFDISDNYAFSRSQGSNLINISDLNNLFGKRFIWMQNANVFLHGNYIYWLESGIIKIYEIVNDLELIDHGKVIEIPDGYIYDLTIDQNKLYLATGFFGEFSEDRIEIYDISIPLSPKYLANFIHSGRIAKMKIFDNILSTAVNSGLLFFDISELMNIHELSVYNTGNWLGDKVVANKQSLYCSNGGKEIAILNPFDQETPTEVSRLYFESKIEDLKLINDTLYVLEGGNLNIFDVSNGKNPSFVHTLSNVNANNFALYNKILFLSLRIPIHKSKVNIVELEKDFSTSFIDSFTVNKFLTSEIKINNNLLALHGVSNVKFYELDGKKMPFYLDSISIGGSQNELIDFEMDSNIIYVATTQDGLLIYKLQANNKLERIANPFPQIKHLNYLSKSSNYLYSTTFGGYYVFDITDPLEPKSLDFVKPPISGTLYINSSKEYIFVSRSIGHRDMQGGISIYENSLLTSVNGSDKNNISEIPTQNKLYQNYPNPFNPSTLIEFDISVLSNVKLEVYNSLGEKVSELINEFLHVGQHSAKLSSKNLSSGIYYYRLSTDYNIQTKKMVILK